MDYFDYAGAALAFLGSPILVAIYIFVATMALILFNILWVSDFIEDVTLNETPWKIFSWVVVVLLIVFGTIPGLAAIVTTSSPSEWGAYLPKPLY